MAFCSKVFRCYKLILRIFVAVQYCAATWIVMTGVLCPGAKGNGPFDGSSHGSNKTVIPLPVIVQSQILSDSIKPLCEALIDDYSDASANWTRCYVNNALTFQRCQSCVGDYHRTVMSYRLLVKEYQTDSTNTKCTETYPGMGPSNVFENIQDFIKKTWTDSGCQNCFSMYTINSSYSDELSNDTIRCKWLALQFFKCIFNDSTVSHVEQMTAKYNFDAPLKNDSNESACVRCFNEYDQLNKFYISTYESKFDKDIKESIICPDLCELMNFTRFVWNNILQCPLPYTSLWHVILATIILGSLPAIFYIASKILVHDVEKTLLIQKRFKRRSVSANSTHLNSDFRNHLSS